jgi:RNA polymerase primary sigma factor
MQSNYEQTLHDDLTAPFETHSSVNDFTTRDRGNATEPTPVPEATASDERAEGLSHRNSTCLSLYLTEIGKVKLLTPEQEIQLANRIKAGDEEAREQMIKANLRLVVKIAREYEGIGLPLMDLISEGNIGLMKAVERFDPTRGAKLATYSVWWIKQSIKRALANQSKTIRLPIHMVCSISKMYRVGRTLQQALGREATDEEIGDELGLKASRIAQMRVAAIRPASLDARIGDEDSSTLADVVEDENAEAPNRRFEEEGIKSTLCEMLQKLKPREAAILSARFGLDGTRARTLEEVGEQFQVTCERVRQIETKALSKLRAKLERLENSDI